MLRICVFSLFAISFTVNATNFTPSLPDIPTLSGDDEWACTVLLCLANPNGAKAVNECVPPIDRLIKHLRKGGKMPRCPNAGEGNRVDVSYEHYNPCNASVREEQLVAVEGWVAEPGKPARYAYPEGRRKVYDDSHSGWHWEYPGLACAKTPAIDSRLEYYWDGTDRKIKRVTVYPKIIWEEPQFGLNFDVFVEGKLWQRVDVNG